MTPDSEQWERLQVLFHLAEGVPQDGLDALLRDACPDEDLRDRARDLILAERAVSQTRESASAPTPSSRIGPYRVIRHLGSGGIGAVYLVERAVGGAVQRSALKVLSLHAAGPLFAERFAREQHILASLNHPNITRMLDAGLDESGQPYLVMEYVEGVHLDRYCDAHSLGISDRLQLFLKVCEAVAYAHRNLVVHLDLKPSNILVTEAEGTVKLLDFGTSKLIRPDSLLTTTVMATPAYASPEQLRNEGVTTASDTFALGTVLFELLAGQRPNQDSSVAMMIERSIKELPPEPLPDAVTETAAEHCGLTQARLRGLLTGDLATIVAKCLQPRPVDRYASVDTLMDDLQRFLAGRPVLARPQTTTYRIAKFVRRNKLSIATGSIAVTMALLGVAGVLWQTHVANRERGRAEARAADLRQLSSSLLLELDEALKDIPGSTGAQKILVTRVLEHLDRMANDAGGDRATALELIEAYTRLGNLQGNVYYQNLADTQGAVASFDKALALAGPLAAANPRDRDALRAQASAFEARGESLSQAGDFQASVNSLRQAVRVFDQVVQLPSVTPAAIFEAAVAYEVLGNELSEDSGLSDTAAGTAAYRRALDMDDQALRIDPSYMAVRRGLPVMHLHLGGTTLETDPAKALREYKLGLQLAEALPAEQEAKLPQVRLRATLHRKIGSAYAELGQYATATAEFTLAQTVIQRLVDADSKNVNALADLQRLQEDRATYAEAAADPRLAGTGFDRRPALYAAERFFEAEADIIRQIVRRSASHEPVDDPWRGQLALVLIRLGAVRHALHQPMGDAGDPAASLTVLRRSAENPHTAASDLHAAVTAELIAEPASVRALPLAVLWAERGAVLTRHRTASYLLLLARAYSADHQREKALAAAREGLSLLPASLQGAPKPRLRRLLEAEVAGH